MALKHRWLGIGLLPAYGEIDQPRGIPYCDQEIHTILKRSISASSGTSWSSTVPNTLCSNIVAEWYAGRHVALLMHSAYLTPYIYIYIYIVTPVVVSYPISGFIQGIEKSDHQSPYHTLIGNLPSNAVQRARLPPLLLGNTALLHPLHRLGFFCFNYTD